MTQDTLKAIVKKLETHRIVKVSKFESCSRDSVFYDDGLSLTLEDNTIIELTLKAYDMTKPKEKHIIQRMNEALSKEYSNLKELEGKQK